MMINRLLSTFMLPLLAVILLSSCDKDGFCLKGEGNTETRVLQLSPINGVKVNGSTKVYINYGAQQHVEVKGQPNVLDVMSTSVDNGTWTVEFDRCLRRHKTVEVFITLPSVNYVALNGSGRIEMRDSFEEPEIQCVLDGSGKISAAFETERAITRLTGSGEIYLNGLSRTQNVSLSGSGKVKAFDFPAENTTVNISGSGDVEVRTSQTLDASISGSGKVSYKGSPTVNSNISGSGKVVKS
ncbi:head GIN domain-containing protein [Botryobacter ruber]|uniref:head GIN domain-containing protein n=1 Tax=Botryobacter ruber TaxID=2171629 RepID=UPI000E0C4FD1|nr:head GIN domain-containing protein [Botryobacter ruber]